MHYIVLYDMTLLIRVQHNTLNTGRDITVRYNCILKRKLEYPPTYIIFTYNNRAATLPCE